MDTHNTAVGTAEDNGDGAATRGQGFGSFLEMFQSASTTDAEGEH